MRAGLVFLLAVLVLAAAAGQAGAERMAVTEPVANVRSGPGTDHAVIWQVERYHPVQVVERRGHWCLYEDFEGDRAWIHDSLLGRMDAVITVKTRCNVRRGPGTDSPVVFTVGAGVPFKVLERRGRWLRVRHADGDDGWIAASLVW